MSDGVSAWMPVVKPRRTAGVVKGQPQIARTLLLPDRRSQAGTTLLCRLVVCLLSLPSSLGRTKGVLRV